VGDQGPAESVPPPSDPTGPPEAAGADQPPEARPLSGAEQLARRLASEVASRVAPPRPSVENLEIFYSLLGYHYGCGTLDAEQFADLWSRVQAAESVAELYNICGDLEFPPPLAHLKDRPSESPRRRWWVR
jgi:hypothetical protein